MKLAYILHLAKWYPNREDDLEGIFIQRHVECIRTATMSVVLYLKASSTVPRNALYETQIRELPSMVEWTVYYQKYPTGFSILDKCIKAWLYFYLSVKTIHAIIRKYGKPNGILVHVLLRTGLVAFWYRTFYKIPFTIVEHHTLYLVERFSRINKLKNILRKFIVRKAQGVITVSHQLANAMKKHGLINPNYLTIYNAVDTQLFFPVERSSHPEINFLHVSEFNNAHKNITGLLQAFANASAEHPNIRLHLVGYGADMELIRNTIKRLSLEAVVQISTKLLGKELAKAYQEADVFVLFSNKENMPCVLAESLCCGTPFLSTDVGGIAEISSPSNSILVEKGNEKALAYAISTCCNELSRFERKSIADQAKAVFSNEAVSIRWKFILNELFTSKNSFNAPKP